MAAFCVVITGGWCFAVSARQHRRNHHSRTCRAEPSRASDAMGICCCSNSCRKQQLLTHSHRFKHKLCEESYDQHRISCKLVPRLYYIDLYRNIIWNLVSREIQRTLNIPAACGDSIGRAAVSYWLDCSCFVQTAAKYANLRSKRCSHDVGKYDPWQSMSP